MIMPVNDSTTLSLTLTFAEVNGVLAVFSELPNKSNSYPLLMKIKAQADAQVASISSLHNPPASDPAA
jgi:hypothetical protein